MTFLADDKMIFNKDDFSLITILDKIHIKSPKSFLHEFSKKNVYRNIEPIDCKS